MVEKTSGQHQPTQVPGVTTPGKRLAQLNVILKRCEKDEAEALSALLDALRPKTHPCLGDTIEDSDADRYRRQATDDWSRINKAYKMVKEEVEALKGVVPEDLPEPIPEFKDDNVEIGLADWAKGAMEAYDTTLDIVANAAVLGGGLTFAAIVSATRGNISYMFYSFLLFMLGFGISISIRLPITWYSCGRNIPVKHRRFWEFIISSIGAAGVGCVVVAFILLAICIQEMDHKPDVPAWQTFSALGAVYTGYSIIGALMAFWSTTFLMFFIWRMSPTKYWESKGSV